MANKPDNEFVQDEPLSPGIVDPKTTPIVDRDQVGQGFAPLPAGPGRSYFERLLEKWTRDPRTVGFGLCSMITSGSYIYFHPEILQNMEHLMPHVLIFINSMGLVFAADSK